MEYVLADCEEIMPYIWILILIGRKWIH